MSHLHLVRDEKTEPDKEYVHTDSNVLEGDELFLYFQPKPLYTMLNFMEYCEPQFLIQEACNFGIENFFESYGQSKETLDFIISQTRKGFFQVSEELPYTPYPQEIFIEDGNFENQLMDAYGLNASQLISLGYMHAVDLFLDNYNEKEDLFHCFPLTSRRELRRNTMFDSNQTLQEALLEFQTIDKDNIDYFLKFWESKNFENI